MNPIRIQRSRAKGWRMPDGAIYVGRPSKWGNPFTVRQREGKWLVFSDMEKDIETGDDVVWVTDTEAEAKDKAIEMYRYSLSERGLESWYVRQELRGKSLVCWCPIGSPCHADALLKIANSEEP